MRHSILRSFPLCLVALIVTGSHCSAAWETVFPQDLLAFFTKYSVNGTSAGKTRCDAFNAVTSDSLVTVNNTHWYGSGDEIQLYSPSGNLSTNSLPPFCRVVLVIQTDSNPEKGILSEVWLPDQWDSRFVAVGNSGANGGINYGDIAYIGVMAHHAALSVSGYNCTLSSDGHCPPSTSETVNFDNGAIHKSVVAAKAVISEYYGTKSAWNYWVGCSDGGREGLLEMTQDPTDFDGIVVGSPASWLAHLHAWAIHVNNQVTPVKCGSVDCPHWIPADLWTNVIHKEVLNQCDDLDGLLDGIINNPNNCSVNFTILQCKPDQTGSDCLTAAQIGVLPKIYDDYYENDNKTYIFGGYAYGGEEDYPNAFVGSAPYGPAVDYYRSALHNLTWNPATLNYADIEVADSRTNFSDTGMNPNLTAFVKSPHNGKLLHYVGWEDQLISPRESIYYYETVKAFMAEDLDDYYRLFTVPGMKHCYSGIGANAFGGAGQASQGMPVPSNLNDSSHDVLLALIEWVESETAPSTLIATKWNDDNSTYGLNYTRQICQYPKSLFYDHASEIFLCR